MIGLAAAVLVQDAAGGGHTRADHPREAVDDGRRADRNSHSVLPKFCRAGLLVVLAETTANQAARALLTACLRLKS
jgi:hypothetical protein